MKGPLYYCDPEKNTECSKETCAYRDGEFPYCNLTTNPRYAHTNVDGEPLQAVGAFETLSDEEMERIKRGRIL
ncbi:MAG: hypothetical protein IKR84_07085 [Oscillibacter sp.]|nr:hypothetical protein [Oscillibacter sp.]